eukprot:Tbor_TRINITY_DN5924_c3_g5::TRINITY_DN5924_c3_g5_i1::g.18927::m.18927/K08956/AFG3; AFG3 family protein
MTLDNLSNLERPNIDYNTGPEKSPTQEPKSTSAGEDLNLAFLRGFHDAEKKREIKNIDSIVGTMLRGAVMALPIVGIYFLFKRGQHKMATELGKKGNDSMFGSVMKQLRKEIDPMGNKEFKVKVNSKFTFKDVVGVPEALIEVKQYVDFLKTPEKFTRLGGRLPKGCLLTGQPGTGKTMLAKAVAGEANAPFFTCSGADFIEVFQGSGPKRVRDLFDSARAEAPSLIFIDEIDAVGSRGNKESAGNISSEENRTINQILSEMDGLQPSEAVVVFAATNFPENLDKALLREGRFDRKVELPMPDAKARKDVFSLYLNKVVTGDPAGCLSVIEGEKVHRTKPLEGANNDVLSERLAGLTPGVSPATISAIVNEAALAAAVGDDEHVTLKHLLPAIDDVLVGKKHRNRMTDLASKRVALHEAGHTVVGWMLAQQSKIIKVSITPRGMAAGFTQQLGHEAHDHTTDMKLFTDICVMLGGRAAEMTQHDTLTTGASDDYQRATSNAIQQFMAFGMSRRVGMLTFDYQRLNEGRMYQQSSEMTQAAAEREATLLVAAAHKVVHELLQQHKEKLTNVADELYEKKELLEEDLVRILGDKPTDDTVVHPTVLAAIRQYEEAATRAGILSGLEESTVQETAKGNM